MVTVDIVPEFQMVRVMLVPVGLRVMQVQLHNQAFQPATCPQRRQCILPITGRIFESYRRILAMDAQFHMSQEPAIIGPDTLQESIGQRETSHGGWRHSQNEGVLTVQDFAGFSVDLTACLEEVEVFVVEQWVVRFRGLAEGSWDSVAGFDTVESVDGGVADED